MSLPSLSLEGKVAIVTGAGGIRGIGRATALTFAEAGADVAVCDIDINVTGETFDLEGTAKEIRKLGRRALAVQADLSKDSDVDNVVAKTVKEFGTIDVLANVAGMSIHVPFMETTREIYDKAMYANNIVARECANLGLKAGLDLQKMAQAISVSTGYSRSFGGMSRRMGGPPPPPRPPIIRPPEGKAPPEDLGTKDKRLSLEMADEVGANTPIARFMEKLDLESTYDAFSALMRR